MKDRLFWSNGKIINSFDFKVHGLSPTAQFGINVFEGIRAYRHFSSGKLMLFRFDDHYERLLESCEGIGVELNYTNQELIDGIINLTSKNNFNGDVAYRIIVYLDSEGTWSSINSPNVVIAPIERSRTNLDNLGNVDAAISRISRINKDSIDPRIKAGANYLNSRYALQEVRQRGFDDAILLDSKGFVSEGCGANIMIFKDSSILTPSINNSILDGITRRSIPELAKKIGFSFEERNILPDELFKAREAFFCGTAAEIKPISTINGKKIGSGEIQLSRKLLAKYLSLVTGDLEIDKSWLTPIT